MSVARIRPRARRRQDLRWGDLDIANRRATISRALDCQGGIKTPKNGKPRRIVLPPQALRALSALPRPLDDEEPVFRTPRGKRLTKGTLAYLWRPIAVAWRAGGGRDLDLHELRHACATLLLERGLAPADVAGQLGHNSAARRTELTDEFGVRSHRLHNLRKPLAERLSTFWFTVWPVSWAAELDSSDGRGGRAYATPDFIEAT